MWRIHTIEITAYMIPYVPINLALNWPHYFLGYDTFSKVFGYLMTKKAARTSKIFSSINPIYMVYVRECVCGQSYDREEPDKSDTPFWGTTTLVCSSSWHKEGHKNMNITWEFHYVIHTNCGKELLTGTKHWKSCPNCYPRRHIFRMIYVNVWAMLWWGGNLSLDTYSSRWHKVGHKNLNRTFYSVILSCCRKSSSGGFVIFKNDFTWDWSNISGSIYVLLL